MCSEKIDMSVRHCQTYSLRRQSMGTKNSHNGEFSWLLGQGLGVSKKSSSSVGRISPIEKWTCLFTIGHSGVFNIGVFTRLLTTNNRGLKAVCHPRRTSPAVAKVQTSSPHAQQAWHSSLSSVALGADVPAGDTGGDEPRWLFSGRSVRVRRPQHAVTSLAGSDWRLAWDLEDELDLIVVVIVEVGALASLKRK